jgi:hypothetical protein
VNLDLPLQKSTTSPRKHGIESVPPATEERAEGRKGGGLCLDTQLLVFAVFYGVDAVVPLSKALEGRLSCLPVLSCPFLEFCSRAYIHGRWSLLFSDEMEREMGEGEREWVP